MARTDRRHTVLFQCLQKYRAIPGDRLRRPTSGDPAHLPRTHSRAAEGGGRMRQNGIEKIFLTYANLSFQENPENLFRIFDVAEQYVSIPKVQIGIAREVIEKIMILAACGDAKSAEELLADVKSANDLEKAILKIAFQAIYGYEIDSCGRCSSVPVNPRDVLFERHGIERVEPKCYE